MSSIHQTPAPFTAEGYRAFNNELEASLKSAPKRPAVELLDEARNHLRRARRVQHLDPAKSVDALHDAVTSMLAALEVAR